MPQVVILAGGLGTRLGSLSKHKPKSLIVVDDRPIIRHILDWVHKQGCKNILILTGHMGKQFNGFTHHGLTITIHQEMEPLGTGGALWNAKELLEKEFILLWGDDYHPIDYTKLIKRHHHKKSLLTMTVTESYKCMNLQHEDGVMITYDKSEKKPDLNGYEAGTSLVNKDIIETYGKNGKWSWEEEIYTVLSGKINTHLDNTPFWDIGTPERLLRLENFFKQCRT